MDAKSCVKVKKVKVEAAMGVSRKILAASWRALGTLCMTATRKVALSMLWM